MTNVADAQRVLSDLESKLADNKAWQAEIETASKSVSFEAHTAGGEARERLDSLNEQRVASEQEQASLQIAVSEARQRLRAEQEAETDEHERSQARMALGLVSGFVARGKALDEKLSAFVEEFQELNRDFTELQKVNYPPATWALIATNMRSATLARLMFTDLQVEFLPPARRHSFAQVIEAWGAHVRLRAQGRLDRGAPAKKDAA